MSINLSELSITELEDLVSSAGSLIEEKRAQARVSAKAEIERIAAAAGVSVEDLLGYGGKARKSAVKKPVDKYRNPKDHTQTWSGRGKRPKWLQEMLEHGGQLENFLIVR